VGGLLLGSGAIERVTDYETGLPGHLTFTGDDVVEDPLIMDERCLSFHVRGRGVTVLSACSHAGVVNACLEAADAHDGAPVDLVLGGFHLAGRVGGGPDRRPPCATSTSASAPRWSRPATAPAGGPRPR
jgi:7,8-dihydropterin-6-yl-methyl-4-(beta-D-ribofuranosyl)aminobenzene 5'-phosphate synthase